MFRINTNPKNFSMKLSNGYTVSMAMGEGTYSSGNEDTGYGFIECAVISPEGRFYPMPGWKEDVCGWMSVEQVADLIQEVRKL